MKQKDSKPVQNQSGGQLTVQRSEQCWVFLPSPAGSLRPSGDQKCSQTHFLPQWVIWMRLHVGLQRILAKKVFETYWTMVSVIFFPIPFTILTILDNLQRKEKKKPSLDWISSNKPDMQPIQSLPLISRAVTSICNFAAGDQKLLISATECVRGSAYENTHGRKEAQQETKHAAKSQMHQF